MATGEALDVGRECTETVSGTHHLITDAALGQSSSLPWRIALPSELEPGEHTAALCAPDRYGRERTTSFAFTVTGWPFSGVTLIQCGSAFRVTVGAVQRVA